jgi:hypothetical protein
MAANCFGPIGNSAILALTAASQTFALGTLDTESPALRLIGMAPNQFAYYIKFGTSGAVTVSTTDGMRVDPSSQEGPLIVPVPSGSTHYAILIDGVAGPALVSYGGFRFGEFEPAGASQIVAVTSTDQRIALPALGANDPSIRLVSTNADITALWVKLGDGAVTGDMTTSMKVDPGSVESPTLIPVSAAQTHLSIFCEGAGGDVVLTPGGLQVAPVPASAIQMLAGPRILGRISGSGLAQELTPTQVTALLDNFTSLLKGLVPASGGGTTTFLRADGAFAAPAVALERAYTVNLSSAANQDFPIQTYDAFSIHILQMTFATDNNQLFLRVSDDNGATFEAGASDYAWSSMYTIATTAVVESDDQDSEIQIGRTGAGNGIGNAAGEYLTMVVDVVPAAGARPKGIHWRGHYKDPSTRIVQTVGSGVFTGNTNPINYIRLFAGGGGNITAGGIFVFGYRYS